MFRIHKKYVIRHAILQYLKSRVDKRPLEEKDLNLSHTSLHDLARKLKTSFAEIYDYHHALYQNRHIKTTLLGGKYYVALDEKGYAAVIDEFWLREGERELNEKIYDKTKWMVPLLAVIITAASLVFSIYILQQTRSQIKSLKSDIEKLKTGSGLFSP